MKRICAIFLCLTLCVCLNIPAFADETVGYTDTADIQHLEAVTALSSLGVIQGYSDGGFHPEDTLTRAEAAKIIALIMNGGRDFVVGTRETVTSNFTDTQGLWAEYYIDYCDSLGIISGRGDGSFDPNGLVTGLELCKMALASLGYDPDALIGPQWAENTDRLARGTDPSLYGELDNVVMAAPISRDNAAQILYNALQATTIMVSPCTGEDGKMSWQFKPSGRTLLKDRFNLDSVGALPAQPE